MNRAWIELAQSKSYLRGEDDFEKEFASQTQQQSQSSNREEDDDNFDEGDPIPWMSFGPPSAALSNLAWKRIPIRKSTGFLSAAQITSLDSTWRALESTFNRVISRANRKLFAQLVEFLENCESNATLGPFAFMMKQLEKKASNGEGDDDVINDERHEPENCEESESDANNQDEEGLLLFEETEPASFAAHERENSQSRLPKKARTKNSSSKKWRKVVREHVSRPKRAAAAKVSFVEDSDDEDDESEESESDPSGEDVDHSSSSSSSESEGSDEENNGDQLDDVNQEEEEEEAIMDGEEAEEEGAQETGETRTPNELDAGDEEDSRNPFLHSASSVPGYCSFLPTALVIGGQDTVDNELVLKSLAAHLESSKGRRRKVVRLSSQQQTSSARSSKSLVDVLANLVETKRKSVGVYSSPADRIVEWLLRGGNERGEGSISNERKTLVVIVEDCEFLESVNLKRLIRALVYVQSRLMDASSSSSVLLIMGISSVAGANGLHGLLDRDDIRHLNIAKFRPEDSILVFDSLFTELFVKNPSQLRLSPRVLSWLHDRFRMDDFSLNAFKRYLKYAVMRHFEKEPLSFLCCAPSSKSKKSVEQWADMVLSKVSDVVSKVQTEKDVNLKEWLMSVEQNRRDVPGFFKFIQLCGVKLGVLSKNQSLARNMLTSDILIKGETRIELKTACLKAPLDVLIKMEDAAKLLLPEASRDRIKKTWSLSLATGEDGIEMKRSLSVNSSGGNSQGTVGMKRSSTTIATTRDKIEKPKDYFRWGAEKRKKWMMEQSKGANVLSGTGTAGDTHGGGSASSAKRDEERLFRVRVISFLEEIIDDHLLRYMRLGKRRKTTEDSVVDHSVYQGAICFDRPKILDDVFSQTQAELVNRALLQPHFYINCECCRADASGDIVQPSMEDTIIAYRLLRGGISLKEWYNSFSALLHDQAVEETEVEEGRNHHSKKKKRSRPVASAEHRKMVLARFVRAACELQYLGLWRGDIHENAKVLIEF